MKYSAILVLFFLIAFSDVSGQDTAYSRHFLERMRGHTHESHTKERQNNEKIHKLRDLTPFFIEKQQNEHLLTDEVKQLFRIASDRPALSSERIYNTTNFSIHYTLSGVNAVKNPTYTNIISPTTPDYIVNMAIVLDTVRNRYVRLGYVMPPSDGTRGGNSKYDVYVADIENLLGEGADAYGFVSPESNIFDNPNSPTVTERSAQISWMVIRNTFTDLLNSGETEQSITEIVIAHEFFHAIQFGYATLRTQDLYFIEGTAVSMEEQLYPNTNNYLSYLPDMFAQQGQSLFLNSNEDAANGGLLEYGAWIFFKHLRLSYGDTIIKNIMNLLPTVYQARSTDPPVHRYIDQALRTHQSDLATAFENYLIANAVMLDTINSPLTYPKANTYMNVLKANYDTNGIRDNFFIGTFNNVQGVTFRSQALTDNSFMKMSANNYKLEDINQDFKITFTPYITFWNEVRAILIKYNKDGSIEVVKSNAPSGWFHVIEVTNNDLVKNYTLILVRRSPETTDFGQDNYQLYFGDEILALSDETTDTNMFIYPNPAETYLKVKVDNTSLYNLRLYNLQGQEVISNENINEENTISNGEITLDVSKLAKGIYVLRLTTNGKTYSKKISIR